MLYLGCARKLASRPETYEDVRRFLTHAIINGSESRKANASEWQALLEGLDARSVSEMILGMAGAGSRQKCQWRRTGQAALELSIGRDCR